MPHKRAKRSVRERKRSESGNDLAPAAKRALESEEVPKSVARVLGAAKTRREFAERRKRGAQGVDADAGEAGRPRKRRKGGDGGTRTGGGDGGRGGLKIMPGESMAHFNRRVEDSMRGSVRAAVQASATRMRQVRKEEEEELAAKAGGAHPHSKKRKAEGTSDSESSDDGDDDDDARSGGRRPTAQARRAGEAATAGGKTKTDRPKEFERVQTSAPKRLNDIVLAPPQLTKLPRKAKKLAAQGGGGGGGGLGKGAGEGGGARSLSEGVRSMAQKAMMEEERERAIRLYREMKKGKTVA